MSKVKELIEVEALVLQANRKNWRLHPDSQKEGFDAVAEDIGSVAPLLAYRDTNDQLTLLNGHMRLSRMHPTDMVHVLLVDVTEDEAAYILRTYDEVGRLAGVDSRKLDELLTNIRNNFDFSTELESLLTRIGERIVPPIPDESLVTKPTHELKFRGYTLPMSQNNAIAFANFLTDYVKANGSYAGLDDRIARCLPGRML